MAIKLTLYDVLLILLILLISFIVFMSNFRLGSLGGQKYVLIYVDNKLVKEISCDERTKSTVDFPFGKAGGYKATLEISDGKIRLQQLPQELCPQGICAHTGWISRSYQSIVCVPNRIMIYFSDSRGPEFDGITY